MNLLEELRDDFVICNICFEEYNEPKQLPCLHTFCHQCLSKYIVSKVEETGAEWFPCPFCRKVIYPVQGGEVRSWADAFPTNFLLSQLSSKLQEKLANCIENHQELSTDKYGGPRIRCSEHPQYHLVGYCTRQRKPVCEQCCIQKHADCIRSHMRERDSRHMAEERRADCQESLGGLLIKLEGIKDRLATHEADLASQKEHVTVQIEATVHNIKSKFDQFFREQKQEYSVRLETCLNKETSRVASARQQAGELSRSFQRLSEKLNSLEDGSLSVKDLMLLDKAQDELKRHIHAVEKLRKDCFSIDIQFYPNNNGFDKVLKGLTIGSLTVGEKSRAIGGARPRVYRYVSDPSSSVSQFLDSDQSVSLPAQRVSPDMFEHVPPTRQDSTYGRALSPSGAAASALSSSPCTAEGPTSGDHEPARESRRRSEGHAVLSSSKKMPTVPDFGSVLIEESRRSRSTPRRQRPVSESSFSGSARRRAVPMETAIDSSPETRRKGERNGRTVEKSSSAVSLRPAPTNAHNTVPPQFPAGDYLSSLDSNITFMASPETGATSSATEDHDMSADGVNSDNQSSRKITCVRHFLANHGSDMKNQPGLVGIAAVCKDRVAISDRWNKVVKLVDISGRVMDVLGFSGDAEPWDLTLRRPGMLVVTYPKEQKIRMIDIVDGGSRMYYRSHFMTRDGYASLATYDATSVIASVCPPFGTPKVHIIDYIGAVLRSIDCSNVAYPRCVDMCGGEEVCVSDWTHHNIKVFTRDGTSPKFIYSGVPDTADAQLKAPMGVAWNGRNHVFIVDGKTSKVHAMCTETGQCSAIFSLPQIPGVELKLVTFVDASPELCRSERALVITTTSGSVQVYDLCNSF